MNKPWDPEANAIANALRFMTRGLPPLPRATFSECRLIRGAASTKSGDMKPEAGVELTQMGYEFWPEALEACVRYAKARVDRPIYVTENGVSTEDDSRRIEYIQRSLRGVLNCLRDGIDVRGYIHWSLLDNFEWIMGYRPKFGLIAVNRETQERVIKPSAYYLGEIARSNSLNQASQPVERE